MTFFVKHSALQSVFISLALIFCVSTFADDNQAEIENEKARKAFVAGDFRIAARAYQAAELYADSPDIKLAAIQKASEAFGKAGLKYKEFLCLKKQISGFADKIDFAKTVEKEYAIGNKFMKGHRDVTLTWLPWIKERNRAVEIYETILKQVPFAKFAPTLKLRLGRIYIENGEYQKSLTILRGLIRQHPKSKAAKYGRFELANALVQLAGKAGDGDGAYAREAEDVLKESLKLYPDDPETQWLKESQRDTDAVRAERLFKLAEFYESRDNKEAAVRYFHDLLSRFPEDEYADKAEKRLLKLDDTYKPRKREKVKGTDPYPIAAMPEERGVILVTPEASGGKWLLPVDDVDLDGEHADREYQSRKKAIAAKRERERRRAARLKARREVARKRLEAKRKAAEAKMAAEQAAGKKEVEKKTAKVKAETAAKLKRIKAETDRRIKEKRATAEKAAKAKKAASEKKKARLKEKKEENKKKDKGAGVETPTEKTASSKSSAESDKGRSSDSANWFDILLALLAVLFIAAAVMMLKKKKDQQ
ncbi:MAG: outer membrane protein assembly factor BamD [Kiritimatiellaeota bacterium]|nr:outer membrane protein assembly factor BamD [Kiritimatiellota bacterium]